MIDYNIIATGSKGNAVVIDQKILIDCGVSFKALSKVYRALKLVLLTHIHSDHFQPTTLRLLAENRPTLRFACCAWLCKPLVDAGVPVSQIDVLEPGHMYGYGICNVRPDMVKRRNGKGRIRMKRAYFNCILLDGTEQMEPVAHKMVLADGEKITAIVEDTAPCEGYEKVDLKGGYLMPGLINLHVHLAGNGKPSAKPRDNAALVRRILSNGLTRAVAYRLVCSYAKLELLGGVTTIRTVGGLADFDTRCRDDAAKGKILAPRILAANEGISVPGGHMAGSVAVAAHNNAEALAQLRRAGEQGVDLVKLMITGGVLDATQKGTPGELKMKPEMVRAVCDEAHRLGYPVAAHTESPEGVKVALENGVDSIEHGAKMDEETIRLYKERGAFVCTTISPALPYALFDPAISGASEKDQYNGRIVFDGVVESARTALANGIPVGLGNDVGCPYVTQYDFWRELCYFHKYCGVSNQFALHTATLRNARLAGVGDVTGSIEAGKSADFIVIRKNPLDDLIALRQLELVVCRGRAVHKPAPKRNKTVDALLDPYLA